MKKRVVVTGIGAVTPLGIDSKTTWKNITNGVSGIGPLTRVDAEQFNVKVAGEVQGFDPTAFIDKKEARRMSRFTHFALAASKMAIQDAGIEPGRNANPERIGVWIGSGIGGLDAFEIQHKRFLNKGP